MSPNAAAETFSNAVASFTYADVADLLTGDKRLELSIRIELDSHVDEPGTTGNRS